jgi:hypothetical protein
MIQVFFLFLSGVRYSMPVAPSRLSVTIGGLLPGTRYHVFVEAVFNTTLSESDTDKLSSYVLGVNTLGSQVKCSVVIYIGQLSRKNWSSQ